MPRANIHGALDRLVADESVRFDRADGRFLVAISNGDGFVVQHGRVTAANLGPLWQTACVLRISEALHAVETFAAGAHPLADYALAEVQRDRTADEVPPAPRRWAGVTSVFVAVGCLMTMRAAPRAAGVLMSILCATVLTDGLRTGEIWSFGAGIESCRDRSPFVFWSNALFWAFFATALFAGAVFSSRR